MKTKLFLWTIFLSFSVAKAQVVFFENFTATFTPAANGWYVQNNSIPIGTATWFQGNGAVFPSFNGGLNDYYACNYLSQGSGSGGTSNFLITPTVNLVNGATFYFVTRKEAAQNFPDRLQLLMSQGSGTGAIPSGTNSVGSFSTVLLDINPNLATGAYPTVWSAFVGTVTGVTGTVVGRFAFRYFFPNGGPSGANGSYIGIDSVAYALPCEQSVFSISPTSTAICSGESALLTAVTTLTNAPTSYTWNNGQNANSIIVSPQTTTSYTLNAKNSIGCVGQRTLTILVNPTPTITLVASTNSVCTGANVNIVASGANSYGWSGAAVSSSSSINYSSTTSGQKLFFVVGTSTAGCVANATLSLMVNQTPATSATVSEERLCPGLIVIVSANGADIYNWSGSSSANVQSFPYATLSAGVKTFTVVGTSTLSGCTASAATSFTVLDCLGVREQQVGGNRVAGSYPNPFNNELYISEIGREVEIYSVTGKLMFKEFVNEFIIVNTSEFAVGLYIVKVFDKNGALIKKLKRVKN